MRTVNWREMTSHGWEVEHPKSAHFGAYLFVSLESSET